VVDDAWNRGSLILVAAGNDGKDLIGNVSNFPSNCNHVLPVGATTLDGKSRASLSNYGAIVLVGAPGEAGTILTTTSNGGYTGGGGGTSDATPQVAGAAADIWSVHPTETPDQIVKRLTSTAHPVSGFTNGLIDVAAAINAPTPPFVPTACSPRPPVSVQTVSNGDGRLKVTLSASNNPGFANTLQAIGWRFWFNGTVEGIPGAGVGVRTPLAGVPSVTFFVKPVTVGQAATVYFTVTDTCGDWPTFVGGGPDAFR